MRVDVRRLEGALRLPSRYAIDFRVLVRGLHAEHEFEVFVAGVVPGEAAFRLEKHRVDGLGLEFAVQHQQGRIVRREFGADLLAIDRGLGVGRRSRFRERRPYRELRILELSGTDPTGLGPANKHRARQASGRPRG